jgi:hypothetical protein
MTQVSAGYDYVTDGFFVEMHGGAKSYCTIGLSVRQAEKILRELTDALEKRKASKKSKGESNG